MENKEKVVLAILDGFGIGENDCQTNAIYAANTPFFDMLNNQYPCASLAASGEPVGIAKNQFGNSELGHMTIGSGRTILGINEKFNKLISEKELDNYLEDQDWIKQILSSPRPIHLCGMYSSGCVHSNLEHCLALIDFFQKRDKKVALYLIADGRDTEGHAFLSDLKNLLPKLNPTTKIICVGGRYYGMDRDKNFNRTNEYYQAMLQHNTVVKNNDFVDYVQSCYDNNQDDEFLSCANIIDSEYEITTGDEIIFWNYRADRIRQIIEYFKTMGVKLIGMCEYANVHLDNIIIASQVIDKTLGELINSNNLKQLRVAETEKFAHVTFFFDAGKQPNNPNQDQILVNSKKVKTYDLSPEMSAGEITQEVINNLADYDFIVVNYANADMVGHTGNFAATKQAIEFLDKQCATLYNNLLDKFNGTLIITADHGNADFMIDSNHQVVKTHSIAKVPFYVLSNKYTLAAANGVLQDIAPSILYIFNIDKPNVMDGNNLIKKK